MSRVKPVDQEAIAALDDLFAPVIERMGFIPLSQQVMAHKPLPWWWQPRVSSTFWLTSPTRKSPYRASPGR